MGDIKELSESDKAQMEYIQKWSEKQRDKEQNKIRMRMLRSMYLSFSKSYFKHAVGNLVLYFKCLLK